MNLRKTFSLVLVAGLLSLWGCEQVYEDVAPISFTNFKLNDDLLYVYNTKDSRVYSAVNDTVVVYDKITYNQPVHGELYPNYANDNPDIMGYKPKPGYVGLDSATYEVCSGGVCKTATIRFVVEAPQFSDPNDCETILVEDVLETTVNTPKEIRIFLNDVICYYPNENWTVKFWGPNNGTMQVMNYWEGVKNDVLIYRPNKNFVGEDIYTYRVYPRGDVGIHADDYQEVNVKITVKSR
ncbi:hypothetical protein I0P70_02570 [Pontibacter sp. FD36]|uniref:hypothetical protein n=1 Tax=Pontibacter sp. FD36 TaxID=2789860 RepID=UPI0018ABBF1F|nr:hypothetical protein [Pontibacter sp. FD36]MBF8962117.1 hypothetical protein [Pontibacter sp. FD36]